MIWLTLLILPAGWLWMNNIYGHIYGRPLRWRYFWAAHGALLFGRRLRDWEADRG